MVIPKKLKLYSLRNIDDIPQFKLLSPELRFNSKVVAYVLPFRTNNYVVDELIDWNKVPNDPMFQLTFMQKGMLEEEDFNTMADLLRRDAPKEEITEAANLIREKLNPHPAAQRTANMSVYNDEVLLPGVQHKYKEIALVFPSSSQTCHAYCTFCFRWAQFTGNTDIKFATHESKIFLKYIRDHKELTDILFTGGDPMVMNLEKLKTYIEPLLGEEYAHIRNIRIGTKSIAYWPYKYVTDPEADDLIKFFSQITSAGKHLSIMGHFNHWVESSTEVSHEAIKRILSTGAVIRTQSPLIKHINDDASIWSRMWLDHLSLGLVPYYMFVERDTGARKYFAVPLYKAFNIFQKAYSSVTGLCRTVRGPSMSATPGKISIEGIAEINGEKVFVLNFIRGRNRSWVRRPFFAKYDEKAIWYDDLVPAFGKNKFFFDDELKNILKEKEEMTNAVLLKNSEASEIDSKSGAA